MPVEIRQPSAAEREEAASWATWECGVSSFEWGYAQEERCLLLEGRAKVEARGRTFELGPGDFVVFPKGLACRWHVLEPVRKRYRFFE